MMPRRPVAQRARAEIADRTAVVSVPRSTEGRSVARARTFDGRESTSADESDTDARVNERPGARARKQLEARGVSIPSLPPTDVRAIALPRWWTPPPGTPAHYEPFGGRCSVDRTFDGVTIPTEYALGWYWGTQRFETEGEFFRCTIDSVEYS